MFEASQFEPFLKLGSIEESKIARRAATLAKNLDWIAFEKFQISAQPYPFPDPNTGQIISVPLAEYHFGETGFSVNNAENANDDVAEWFGGTGLDRGHLQFLSKVGETARSLIPNYWLKSKRLRDALRNPAATSQHRRRDLVVGALGWHRRYQDGRATCGWIESRC